MDRRLYFVFPSRDEAEKAVDELENTEHVPEARLHVIAREGVDLKGLPGATVRQQRDARATLAGVFWKSELGVFVIALLAFAGTLVVGFSIWSMLALAVMGITLASGIWYAVRVPDITLKEFEGSLAHDEVLLMVDVQESRVNTIERRVQSHHPAAVMGGSSWTMDFFGI